ncbi:MULTISPECIES: hypothetical protein [unclassified Mesorhizobium]|uniref:hypothetical protein n=1 Tax=unclassified Mesorhizobium TaxID=325217 RepID=UPI00333AA86A
MTRPCSPCFRRQTSLRPKAPGRCSANRFLDPATRRTGLIVAVRKLHIVLPALFEAGARLEHLYD